MDFAATTWTVLMISGVLSAALLGLQLTAQSPKVLKVTR
jgi:hypothetical protein